MRREPTQPQFGTRTISSNIRLKDGETNFLAGLYRLDKSDIKHTIPFIGDIPVMGRLFNHNTNDHRTTDLVLTLTPHIIRIPDVTEDDVTPYFVGTDSNISYQGGPRVENPTRDNGPFEQPAAGRMPPANPGGRTPPQPAQPAAQPVNPVNIAPPGSGPTDIFKPAPPPPPPGAPQAQVPPQASLSSSSSDAAAGVAAKSAAADVAPAPDQAFFDFDPAYLALAVGAQQSILVRATSAAALTGGRSRSNSIRRSSSPSSSSRCSAAEPGSPTRSCRRTTS